MPAPPPRRRRRLVRGVLLGVAAVWVGTVLLVLDWGRSERGAAGTADAIVVLGAAQYDGRPSPVLKGRLDHGVRLFRAGVAPRLVVTGGRGVGDTTSEAAVGRRYAVKAGVPARAIALEDRGRTTEQSMRAVARMLRARPPAGTGSAATPGRRPVVVLVSDPFHMLRLAVLARRLGLDARTSPTRTSPFAANGAERWRYVLGESIKVPLTYLTTTGDE